MNLRKFKHDPADLLRQGEEIAATRKIDPKYKFRVVTVNMVLSGRCTAAQAAELAGVSRMAANDWARTVDRDGFEALKGKKLRRQEAQAVSRTAPRGFALSCRQPQINLAATCGAASRFLLI